MAPWMAFLSALLTRTFLKAAGSAPETGAPVFALISAPSAVL